MSLFDAFGLFVGAVALGFVHGIEPGHGWPVAASYALDRSNKWLAGLAAGLVLGVGHLVSSIVMVGLFFLAQGYFDLTQVNDPLRVLGVEVGGPVSVVAGIVLIILGVREYTHGHGHSHGHDGHTHGDDDHGDTHRHDDHDHSHSHDGGGLTGDRVRDHLRTTPLDRPGAEPPVGDDHQDGHSDVGWLGRLKQPLPGGGHSHVHQSMTDAADRGLLGIAWFAFLLGFAHEEEFEIIALCVGSTYCLELMTAYALTVIVGIVGLTLLLVAGYEHFEEEAEQFTPYLPVFSAVVLVVMGLGFVLGVF